MKAKTVRKKTKKKPEKTLYTYEEYIEELRPKSLGRVEDVDNMIAECYDQLSPQKARDLPCDYLIDHV